MFNDLSFEVLLIIYFLILIFIYFVSPFKIFLDRDMTDKVRSVLLEAGVPDQRILVNF